MSRVPDWDGRLEIVIMRPQFDRDACTANFNAPPRKDLDLLAARLRSLPRGTIVRIPGWDHDPRGPRGSEPSTDNGRVGVFGRRGMKATRRNGAVYVELI